MSEQDAARATALDPLAEATDNSGTEPEVSQDPNWAPPSTVDAAGKATR
jgi:hypothetical protein